jgi:TRAP-type C4-dicarboxylate transport system substrate-binding protein
VNLSWGDTVQGLRSGVVDGAESWNAAFVAFGMAGSIGEIILNEWTIGNEVIWADVEWLQGLSTEDREIIAEETKKLHEELASLTSEVNQQRIGATQPPTEGSAFAKEEITVNELNEQEQEEWKSTVKKEGNSDLYSDIIENANQLGIDGEGFYEYLHDSARESAVPSSLDNFSVDTWWNDYIDQIEV